MKQTTIETLNGADLVKVRPEIGRHFYCIERYGRTVSRTYETLRVARKALRIFAHNSPYPIIAEWMAKRIDQSGHCAQ